MDAAAVRRAILDGYRDVLAGNSVVYAGSLRDLLSSVTDFDRDASSPRNGNNESLQDTESVK